MASELWGSVRGGGPGIRACLTLVGIPGEGCDHHILAKASQGLSGSVAASADKSGPEAPVTLERMISRMSGTRTVMKKGGSRGDGAHEGTDPMIPGGSRSCRYDGST